MARWISEHISAVEMNDGRFFVKNHETGEERMMTRMQLAELTREHATSDEHYALGDAVHDVASWLGFSGCLPCAERQKALNHLIPKRKKERDE